MTTGAGEHRERHDRASAERVRLQRAAFGRGATGEDRAALAAFDRRHAEAAGAVRPSSGEAADTGDIPHADAAGGSHSSQDQPLQHAPRTAPRRGVELALAAGLGASAAIAGAVLIVQPWQSEPFDRFTEPESISALAAGPLLRLSQLDPDPTAVVVAGPSTIYEAEDLEVAAFVELDLDSGEQDVCAMVIQHVGEGATRIGDSTGWECTPRAAFESDGITIGLSPRIEATVNDPSSGLPFWLTWHPSDEVELHDRAPAGRG